MGEARRRGTLEERIASARARADALRPAFIVCNGCAARLEDVARVDVAPMPGLDAVHVARCSACDAETYDAQGTPEALRAFAEFMRSQTTLGDFVGGRYARNASDD